MKIINNNLMIEKVYDVRSLIYTLLISSSLLFLLNLKTINNDFFIYILILIIMLMVSCSEFLFAIRTSAKIYHKNHPLHHIYKRLTRHHLYNIILLPIVQYVTCSFLIYYNNELIINIFVVILSSIMTYFTFFAYKDIYSNNLQIHHLVEEFFDASRYVSFAFITYLLLLLQTTYAYPRSITAIVIGVTQLIYVISSLWRRYKLNLKNTIFAIISSLILSLITYILLMVFNLPSTLLFMTLTAQILIIDYVMSSLLIKYIQKHLNIFAFLEYILIILIAVSLLYFSK